MAELKTDCCCEIVELAEGHAECPSCHRKYDANGVEVHPEPEPDPKGKEKGKEKPNAQN